MRLFAIGDLHLPGGNEKPMDIFGPQWENHFSRIREDWLDRVTEHDAVLIPGDISWAMQLRDASADLDAIGELPGRKLILRGNHDYWWSSLTQVRAALPAGMEALQNNAVDLGACIVCGTRGWAFSAEGGLTPEDEKILKREVLRLRMSLDAGVQAAAGRPLVVMMHYPPLYETERETPFTQLLREYPVSLVVYGHLHGAGIRVGFNGEDCGIRYRLVSCDALGFRLSELELQEM